jgi:hypothetical protein
VRTQSASRQQQSAAGRRRAGSQTYLLQKYEELGTFHDAVWELAHLHDREPGHYRQVTGGDALPQYETIRQYWKSIPLVRRRAAKQRFLRRT